MKNSSDSIPSWLPLAIFFTSQEKPQGCQVLDSRKLGRTVGKKQSHNGDYINKYKTMKINKFTLIYSFPDTNSYFRRRSTRICALFFNLPS